MPSKQSCFSTQTIRNNATNNKKINKKKTCSTIQLTGIKWKWKVTDAFFKFLLSALVGIKKESECADKLNKEKKKAWVINYDYCDQS